MRVEINEISTTMMEITVDSVWLPLGRDIIYRYAESLAQAASLGTAWQATRHNTSDDRVSIILIKDSR